MTASITETRAKITEDVCMGVTMEIKLGKERSDDIRGMWGSVKVIGSMPHNYRCFHVQ